jgi:hypothetical protein
MKNKLTLLILMLFGILAVQAQNQRLVLAEGFSSATCGPCAAQNPAWNALLHNNQDIVTSIKYQMNWPAPGTDPMYHHNPIDNTARRNYYSVNSVPNAVINGNHFQGTPSQVNQTMLQTVANITSPFEIQLQHQLNAAQDSIFLTMLIKADAPVSGNLVAHIAVIEKHIHFVTPPGTNGERDFYNIMKALLPTRNGTSLPNFQPGEYVIIEAAWKLANVYSIDQLAAVGFVQDNNNKHVHQAARSSEDPIVPFYANDAAVKSIYDYTKTNCSGLISNPKVSIANHGYEALTTAQIVANINGNEVYNEVWTGNLGFLERATIELGDLPFGIIATNELTIEITQTNGQDDDYPVNATKSVNFNGAPNTSGNLNLFLFLDNNPHETTWELFNSSGEVVLSGGPYSNPGQQIIPLNISEMDCYQFVIYDAGGNGICCSHGTGYYGILAPNGQPLFSGSDFGSQEIHEFGYGLVAVDENIAKPAINIQPNPAQNTAAVSITLENAAQVEISLMDMSGRQINSVNYGIIKAGTHNFSDWFVELPKGIYLVQVKEGQNLHSRKLVIQ